MSDIAPATPAAAPAAPSTPSPAPAAPAAKAGAPAAAPSKTAASPSPSATKAPVVPGINDDAPAADAAKDAAAKAAEAKRKYKLRVDKTEREVELSDDEVSVRLQKAEAAEKRMQEAAEVRKQFKSIIDAIKANPAEALKDPVFGVDVRKMIEDQILAEYEAEQLTPEEREKSEMQKKLEAFEKQEAERKEQAAQAKRAELEAKVKTEMERDFIEAIEKSGLPKTRQTLAMMAEVARLNLEHEIDLTPAQLAAEVRDRMTGTHKHFVANLKGEELLKYLGDDVVKEVVRSRVATLRPGAQPPKPFEPPAAQDPSQMSFDDVDDSPKARRKLQDPRAFRKFIRGE